MLDIDDAPRSSQPYGLVDEKAQKAHVGDYFYLPRNVRAVVFVQNTVHAGKLIGTEFTHEFSNAYDGKPFIVMRIGLGAFNNYVNRSGLSTATKDRRLVLLPLDDRLQEIQTQGPVVAITQEWGDNHVETVVRRFADDAAKNKTVGYRHTVLEIAGNRADLVHAAVARGMLRSINKDALAVRKRELTALNAEIDERLAGVKDFLGSRAPSLGTKESDAVMRNIASSLRACAEEEAWEGALLPKIIRAVERPRLVH
jgi:hypothetical protein